MPKSPAEIMANMRARRKAAKQELYSVWIRISDRKKVAALLAPFEQADPKHRNKKRSADNA